MHQVTPKQKSQKNSQICIVEFPGHDVDYLVRKTQGLIELTAFFSAFLFCEEEVVRGVFVFCCFLLHVPVLVWCCDAELLHLVELVHTKKALCVFAVRTSLLGEARAEAGISDWKVLGQQKQRGGNISDVDRCLSSLTDNLHAVNKNIKQIVYANHHKRVVERAMYVYVQKENTNYK